MFIGSLKTATKIQTILIDGYFLLILLTFDFVQVSHARHSSCKHGSALAKSKLLTSSKFLTLGIAHASMALLSLNRNFQFSILTSSKFLTLGIAHASMALLLLNRNFDFVQVSHARHSSCKQGSALAKSKLSIFNFQSSTPQDNGRNRKSLCVSSHPQSEDVIARRLQSSRCAIQHSSVEPESDRTTMSK